jgi:hypothetical protein
MFACAKRSAMAAALLMSAAAAALGQNGPPSGIVWGIGLAAGAQQAHWERKPLVVFIYQEKMPPCDQMMETLMDERLDELADRAVFVWQDAFQDDTMGNVSNLIKLFKIDRVPTVIVLDIIDVGVIREVGRVVGVCSADEALQRLQPLLEKPAKVKGPIVLPPAGPPVPVMRSIDTPGTIQASDIHDKTLGTVPAGTKLKPLPASKSFMRTREPAPAAKPSPDEAARIRATSPVLKTAAGVEEATPPPFWDPPRNIVWRIGLARAYQQARWERKALVVFLHLQGCPHCNKMIGTLFDDRFGPVANRAIFVWQDARRDDANGNVRKLIQDLGITNVPSVVVLDVSDEKMMNDTGYIKGAVSLEETLRVFKEGLDMAEKSYRPHRTAPPLSRPADADIRK